MRLGQIMTRIAAANPSHRVAVARERWLRTRDHLQGSIRRYLEQLTNRAALAERALRSLSPEATLERGYAIVSRQDDQSLVTDSASIDTGAGIGVRLARGHLTATVDTSEPSDD